MKRTLIAVTKFLIAALFVALVVCQVWVVPVIAAALARIAPEFGQLQAPGVVLVGILLVCGEVVLVCAWRVLTLVSRGSVFDARSLPWVDATIAALAVAGVVVVTGMTVIGNAQAGSPFLALTGAVTLVTIAGVALVVLVMRGNLARRAIQLPRADGGHGVVDDISDGARAIRE